ncbi:thiolase family protein [Actinomycetospora termitidis]|uniref:Thiolase family protein n=1 Tax=Actinomycetospora termitidis TaxID=3053470 RepID=A0ABT7MG67_9PSEU|nr:thiolase family protein [Actinomycetospora sp. Odt1-22]MDL5159660.1 thiolase family protein [Actinomycetospora sp. Odt1-22]
MTAPALRPVHVVGVATTRFGKHLDRTLGSLTEEAVAGALADAGLSVDAVGTAVFSNAAAGVLCGQEMIRGQVALKGTGLAGIPVVNTENACASGGSAVHLAWLAVASGQVDTAISVGAEKLFHPDKARSFAAIESGTDLSLQREGETVTGGSVMMGAYAAQARAYAAEHGDIADALAAVAVKNRTFASGNPDAQFRDPVSIDDVAASRPVADPLRLLTCSPLTDGAAAVVLTARDGASTGDVSIATTTMVSHRSGSSVVRRAADQAYSATGLTAADIDVFALHDACAFAELVQYEQVGLVPVGQGADAARDGRTGPGGTAPVNTDGGLLSRGHALGATGVAQIVELTRQLRGSAGQRQVPDARRALAVNSGGWMGDDYATSVATLLTGVA